LFVSFFNIFRKKGDSQKRSNKDREDKKLKYKMKTNSQLSIENPEIVSKDTAIQLKMAQIINDIIHKNTGI